MHLSVWTCHEMLKGLLVQYLVPYRSQEDRGMNCSSQTLLTCFSPRPGACSFDSRKREIGMTSAHNFSSAAVPPRTLRMTSWKVYKGHMSCQTAWHPVAPHRTTQSFQCMHVVLYPALSVVLSCSAAQTSQPPPPHVV
jgi:hypothetical protein